MRTLPTAVALALAASLWIPATGSAQQVDITAPAPTRPREPLVVPPGDHDDATRPSDESYYPRGPRVRHDPAFIGPLSTKTPAGRAGVAGWTAPAAPVGAEQTGFREVNGWFALGFAFEWGGPPARPAAPPAGRQRSR